MYDSKKWNIRKYVVRFVWLLLLVYLFYNYQSYKRTTPIYFKETEKLYHDFFAGFKNVEHSLIYKDTVDIDKIQKYVYKIKKDNNFSSITDKGVKDKYNELEELLYQYTKISNKIISEENKSQFLDNPKIIDLDKKIKEKLGVQRSFLLKHIE